MKLGECLGLVCEMLLLGRGKDYAGFRARETIVNCADYSPELTLTAISFNQTFNLVTDAKSEYTRPSRAEKSRSAGEGNNKV